MADGKTRLIDRRAMLGVLGGSAVAGALPAAPLIAQAPLQLDLEKPEDNLTAWMKMRASLESQDVYFWFTGALDLAMPGEPIRPIINVDTVILRRTQRLGAHSWHVTDWEASIYRDFETDQIVEEVVNPVTGDTVRPFHYREGPVTFDYSAERQPRLVGLPTPFEKKDEPFRQRWRQAGDDLWMIKEMYIWGIPQWLDIKQFPDETPETPINVSSITTMKSSLRDVLDPTLASVPTEYFYQATSDWLPWMKMGQRPGFVVWHEAGKKLFSLDDLPATTRTAMEQIHPQWFVRPVPWEGFTNMFFLYRQEHSKK
ncbi:MAG: DUF1838 domain-containing protein [Gammaproteobacteria bacterium]|nr:DUF1838 domain-containing protein [Gammaproteobacteria bacterium]